MGLVSIASTIVQMESRAFHSKPELVFLDLIGSVTSKDRTDSDVFLCKCINGR